MSEHQHAEVEPHWFDAYDNTPANGPAVFAATVDATPTRGGWVELADGSSTIQPRLIAAVGITAVHDGTWRIIDQLDMGEVMVDEDLTAEALRIEAARAAGGTA